MRPAGRLVSGAGQTLLTLGVVLLLFCAYELEGTALRTARTQDQLGRELAQTWSAPPPAPPPDGPVVAPVVAPARLGAASGRLYLPTLRGREPLVVVEGVGVPELQRGPGHLPGSAAAGELGNAVYSGHRTTYGAPFGDLDRLRPGDPVILETRDTWVTYRVTGLQVVRPSAVEITLPVPGRPGAQPTQRLLTLTTCHPRYSAAQRLVVRAEVESSTPVPGERPPLLRS